MSWRFPAIPSDELARIMVPAALISGRHDRVMPLQTAREASARFGWPLQVIGMRVTSRRATSQRLSRRHYAQRLAPPDRPSTRAEKTSLWGREAGEISQQTSGIKLDPMAQ